MALRRNASSPFVVSWCTAGGTTATTKEQHMAGVNKIIVVGNLGRDPEVRYSQSGTAICTFSVAVTERRKVGDEWKEHTEWFRVKTFGKVAENAGQYLQKGKQVYVDGRLEQAKYKDKDGNDRLSVEIVANSVQYLGSAPRRDAGSGAGSGAPLGAGGEVEAPAADGFIDDDLPF